MKKVNIELLMNDDVSAETLINTIQNGNYTILSTHTISSHNDTYNDTKHTMYAFYMDDDNRYNALLKLQNTLLEEHSAYKKYITIRNNYLTNMPLEYNKEVEVMLENVLEVYHYYDIIQYIVGYLVPLPQHIDYEKLQLSQNILRHYMHIDTLFRSPKAIEAVVLHEFTNYQKLYKKHYVANYTAYIKDYEVLKKDVERVSRYLSASERMSEIPLLDEKSALETFSTKLQHFKKSLPERFYSLLEVQEMLEIEPYVDDFTLNKQVPNDLFSTINSDLLAILHRQYDTIYRTCKQSLLHNHGVSDVSKLLDMMRISDKNRFLEVIENIANDDELMHILQLLLSKKPVS